MMDFANDAVNDVGSPPPPAGLVNGAAMVNAERPILDEMIARMQQEQDERSGAAAAAAARTSSRHQLRTRSIGPDQPTATATTGDKALIP